MPVSIVFISLLFMALGMAVQYRLKRKFATYSKVPTTSGLSGKEVAEKMLHDHGIFEVTVVSVPGFLSDHYDPSKKTVNLSPDVFEGRNVASAAVAAHECGHAVQHAAAYSMLTFRSILVPVVQVSSNLAQWIILIGLGLFSFGGGNPTLLLAGIILFGLSTLFSIVTLPVEIDASARALKWLDASHLTTPSEHEQAKDALKWAAFTYVIAALASIALLIQYIMIYQGRRRN
ncbi:MAG: zinc metallopeptidase [Bacteroidota bacterium]|nr:zinc metallopeptidase [Bacteroidota bacterium]